MEELIKQNIIDVLNSLKQILNSPNIISADLKKLSNQLMEDVSLFHDQDSISIVVLVYSLYKIFNKDRDLDKTNLIKLLKKAIISINIDIQFRTNIRKLFDQIKKYDDHLSTNIIDIIHNAHIKKGLKVYEHGLSIGLASEIIGVSRWKLMEYIGNSNLVSEDEKYRIDNKTRLNFTRGLFK